MTELPKLDEQLIATHRAADESEQRFRNLADAVSPLIWITDASERCTWVNQRWLEFSGMPLDSQLGHGWLNLIHPDDRENIEQTHRRSCQSHTEFKLEYRLRQHDNQYRWFVVNAAPRFTPDEQFAGFIGMNLHNHELRSTQRQLERCKKNLDRANEKFAELGYVAAHDLKQPLRAIKYLSQWIKEDASEQMPIDSQNHFLTLQNRVTKMESLLDNLQTFCQAGRSINPRESFTLRALVEDIFSSSSLSPLELIYDGHDMEVKTDRLALETVLRNLIQNAIQHHHSGNGFVKVSAKVDSETQEVLFAVQDDGPGISAVDRSRIFEVFQTLQSEEETPTVAGMGLPIAQRIAETRNGSISIDASGTPGCTFRVIWPL